MDGLQSQTVLLEQRIGVQRIRPLKAYSLTVLGRSDEAAKETEPQLPACGR